MLNGDILEVAAVDFGVAVSHCVECDLSLAGARGVGDGDRTLGRVVVLERDLDVGSRVGGAGSLFPLRPGRENRGTCLTMMTIVGIKRGRKNEGKKG